MLQLLLGSSRPGGGGGWLMRSSGDGALPGDADVLAAETHRGFVVGNGDVADPVGVLAPDLGSPQLLEDIGQVDVGGGEEVVRDLISTMGHPETLEEFTAGEMAAPAVLGKWVEVEGVVAGLRHLVVADELGAKERVHMVQQLDPLDLAVDLHHTSDKQRSILWWLMGLTLVVVSSSRYSSSSAARSFSSSVIMEVRDSLGFETTLHIVQVVVVVIGTQNFDKLDAKRYD
ncbi:hypothetical protein M0R45_003468 [Rubus argutus]|uniref:Uncharacterized protein n=1 Tax=Rubus argutus TaxID=59490 RepID=A0AAW1YGH6_RUBAR